MTITATRQAIRYVPNTHRQFRYPNEDELQEGLIAWMVDIDNLPASLGDLNFFGKTEITVDSNPRFSSNGRQMVYYHCTRPAWEGQCFVPVVTMTCGYADRNDPPRPGPRHEYWVPTW